jgi:hypothetical protein
VWPPMCRSVCASSVLRIEAEWSVKRTLHSAKRDEGSRDEQSAERDLGAEKQVAERIAMEHGGVGRARLHGLRETGGPHLAERDESPEKAAGDGKKQREEIDACVGADSYTDRKLGERLPLSEAAQERERK